MTLEEAAAYIPGPLVCFIFVETDTRRPLYQQDAEQRLQPWEFDSREEAEEWLEVLAGVRHTGTGRPLSREWIDIVGLDADNRAKYREWNVPAAPFAELE